MALTRKTIQSLKTPMQAKIDGARFVLAVKD